MKAVVVMPGTLRRYEADVRGLSAVTGGTAKVNFGYIFSRPLGADQMVWVGNAHLVNPKSTLSPVKLLAMQIKLDDLVMDAKERNLFVAAAGVAEDKLAALHGSHSRHLEHQNQILESQSSQE